MKANEVPEVDVDIYKVNKIIKKYTAISTASGFILLPIADLAALSAVQLKMIHEIGKEYGHPFSENAGKSIGIVSFNALTTNSLSALGASALKLIPGIGTTLGGYAFHAYAAASTYAIGKLFNNHFASGGTLLTFNAEKVKDTYNRLVSSYKKGGSTAETKVEPA